MKNLAVLLGTLLTATLLAACGGASSVPAGSVLPQAANQARLPDKAVNSLSKPDGCATKPCIYVPASPGSGNCSTTSAVMQWTQKATGDVAPRYAICGSHTGLEGPFPVAVDAGGNIYVGNRSPSASVTVYASGSHGNQRPIQNISSGWIGSPFGLGVDAAGNIYVVNGQYPGSVLVFPPGSNGNVAPIQNISIPGVFSTNIAVAANGQMYVTCEYSNGSYHSDSVMVYAPGSTGSTPPIQTINGPDTGLYNPVGIALDSQGNMYVSNYVPPGGPSASPSVTVYAAGANGDAAPIRTITGSNTGLDYNYGIALDATGNIYVMNAEGGPSHNGSITVYRNKSNGNVAPVRSITGSNVVGGSWGIAVH